MNIECPRLNTYDMVQMTRGCGYFTIIITHDHRLVRLDSTDTDLTAINKLIDEACLQMEERLQTAKENTI